MTMMLRLVVVALATAAGIANAQPRPSDSHESYPIRSELRDPTGKLVGHIRVQANGNRSVHDLTGRQLGTYDARSNSTRNIAGRIVGRGDLLVTLLNTKK
jgi:hypothetical protein